MRRQTKPPTSSFRSTVAALAALLALGCTKLGDRGDAPAAGRDPKGRGKSGTELLPGYLGADRARTPPVRSVAKPPPAIVTTDPKLVDPGQRENVVVGGN